MGKKKIHIDQIKKEQFFKVPKGYFDQLPAKIETRIALETTEEELSKFPKSMPKKQQPFEVPDNYFDNLQSKIGKKIADIENDEPLELNPLLFNKNLPFDTPNDYFEELPTSIQDKIQHDKVKQIFLFDIKPQMRWVLATAAMIVFVIGYVFLFQPEKTLSTDELIAQVSTDDLIAFLESTDISTEEILENIDSEVLSDDIPFSEDDLLDNIDDETLDGLLDEFDYSIDT